MFLDRILRRREEFVKPNVEAFADADDGIQLQLATASLVECQRRMVDAAFLGKFGNRHVIQRGELVRPRNGIELNFHFDTPIIVI